MLQSTFSKNLVKFRKQKGFSQFDLAKKTGLTVRIISHYENGVIKPPIDKFEKIAKCLEVKVSDLLGEEKELDGIVKLNPRFLKIVMRLNELPKADKITVFKLINSLHKEHEAKKSTTE